MERNSEHPFSPLTQSRARSLQKRLEVLQARLCAMDDEVCTPLDEDWMDQATELENQRIVTSLEHTLVREIEMIQAALKRISNGADGICRECGETIDSRRLAAVPHTTVCIDCAE